MSTDPKITAATDFVKVWGFLAQSLPSDYHCYLTCTEADSLARLFKVYGHVETAVTILGEHAADDEDGDSHFLMGESEIKAYADNL